MNLIIFSLSTGFFFILEEISERIVLAMGSYMLMMCFISGGTYVAGKLYTTTLPYHRLSGPKEAAKKITDLVREVVRGRTFLELNFLVPLHKIPQVYLSG